MQTEKLPPDFAPPPKLAAGRLQALMVKFLYVCLAVRLLSALVKAFLPHDLPHRWREHDTYGVAVRYWIRWTTDASHSLKSLIPAILHSGDTYGYMAMEFPAFNLAAAPFTGAGPVWGYFLAHFLMSALNVGLLWYTARIWGDAVDRVQQLSMRTACLVMVLFTVASAYIFKFIPDFLSFILVFIAVSGAWVRGWKVLPFFLAALGLLIKPPSIIVFALLLLHPAPVECIKKNILWIAGAALCAVLYYTLGLRGLRTFQELPDLYAVSMRPPLTSLLQFLSEPIELFRLLFDKLLFAPGLLLPLLLAPVMPRQYNIVSIKLVAVLTLQVLAIGALDGEHSFIHEYYFIGSAPVLALIVINCYEGLMVGSMPRKWKLTVLTIGMLSATATLADRIQFNLRSLIPGVAAYLQQSDCLALKVRHPELPWNQGYVFRSEGHVFPETGVCFHEREGSKASAFGLFSSAKSLPPGCALIDQEGLAVVASCESP